MLLTVFIYVAGINFSPASSDLDDVSLNKRSDDHVPCEFGWYYFREKCYKAFAQKTFQRLHWESALEKCRKKGGDLVSIQSQEENDFVVTFLQLDIKAWIWTGLNDRDKESRFKWSDGSVFNYTNWKQDEPAGGEHENCVHLVFETDNDIIGKWNDRACIAAETYICEKNKDPRRRSPNPMYCPSESGGGWKWEKSCYHVVMEKQSWQAAEIYCRNTYNGTLATISDTLEDYFLEHILANIKEDLWIGIKIKNELLQKWSSGWFVSYDGFNKEQLNFKEGTCVARKKRKEWVTIPCSTQLSFLCEVSKETPPVLKLPAKGSRCPIELSDWKDLGGDHCYYIEKEKELNFHDANFDCKSRGANLVSLHSNEESETLLQFVKYIRKFIYIGLVRRHGQADDFAWTDGSPVDYENWNNYEPNNAEHRCVEAITGGNPFGNMFAWTDISCDDLRSYICSVKKIIPTSLKEDDDCTNYCIARSSHLHQLLIESPDAKKLP